jgi:hypothetical protein
VISLFYDLGFESLVVLSERRKKELGVDKESLSDSFVDTIMGFVLLMVVSIVGNEWISVYQVV